MSVLSSSLKNERTKPGNFVWVGLVSLEGAKEYKMVLKPGPNSKLPKKSWYKFCDVLQINLFTAMFLCSNEI